MPVQLLNVVCADYQATLDAQCRHSRALTDAADRYQRGDTGQLAAIARHLQALRDLHHAASELLFAADTAVTTLIGSDEARVTNPKL